MTQDEKYRWILAVGWFIIVLAILALALWH